MGRIAGGRVIGRGAAIAQRQGRPPICHRHRAAQCQRNHDGLSGCRRGRLRCRDAGDGHVVRGRKSDRDRADGAEVRQHSQGLAAQVAHLTAREDGFRIMARRADTPRAAAHEEGLQLLEPLPANRCRPDSAAGARVQSRIVARLALTNRSPTISEPSSSATVLTQAPPLTCAGSLRARNRLLRRPAPANRACRGVRKARGTKSGEHRCSLRWALNLGRKRDTSSSTPKMPGRRPQSQDPAPGGADRLCAQAK